MAKMGRRTGRLFCLLLTMAAMSGQASTPAMTTINDVLYRADGSPARGTLLISWPAFTTADSKPVAAGTLDVTLGQNGEVQLELAPNAGANPAGTYYKVVLKLDDGSTNTEYWVVPASSPTTVAAIRSRLAPATVAMQTVTREYVDSLVAAKANDSTVVHRDGAETISGSKQFTSAPSVPAPVGSGDVVNKAYVDAAVVAVGAGSYISKNGDAMSGPLTLAADPSAPMQASTRHYVDITAAGLVPNSALSTTPGPGLVPQAGSSPALEVGWLGSAPGNSDQLLGKVAGDSGPAEWWTLPTNGANGCSGITDKLLYDAGAHALTCGSDQTGGGGPSWGFASLGYSATPTFNASAASTFKMTLSGDVSSSTLANAAAGQILSFVLCQDGAGNHNFSWPSNMKGGMAVGLEAGKCSAQSFVYDGTQAWATGVVNQ
jgi:hypothetical protein